MKIFKIEIKEMLCRIVDIEADSKEDALEKAENMYKNEDLILDRKHHISTEIIPYNGNSSNSEMKLLIDEVIDYLYKDEEHHYEEYEENNKPKDHIFLKLLKLKKLNNGRNR